MKFNIISLMPELIEDGLKQGVVGKAFQKGLCELKVINPREFTEDVHQTVDDRPFGGGDGMLMMAEPLQKALDSFSRKGKVLYLSPQGQTLKDSLVKEWAKQDDITLICGRYGGVDQRFLEKNQIEEVSIGDYVLSGGELAALVVIDAVGRQLPGVLGHDLSAVQDSFSGQLLESPHFTRPQEWRDMGVPPILLSGDHRKIEAYKKDLSILVTLKKRPDLLTGLDVDWSQLLKRVEKWPESHFCSTGIGKDQALAWIGEKL